MGTPLSQPVALLNTTIITADGTYVCRTLKLAEATHVLIDATTIGYGFQSYIGHEATAGILAELFGYGVPVNREPFTQQHGQAALCFKLRGRAAEGAILDRKQVEAIGYDFKLLTRTA